MPRGDEDSSSSSDSNSSSEEESGIPAAVRMPAPHDEDPSASADPESPSAAQQSSDESGSSDGVLVDLPGNPDQDSRCLQSDADGGILVNIDGSMQEQGDVHNVDQGEETGREETFLDAPDHLGSARSLGLEESMAMIEIRESSEGRAHDHARLDDTLAECRKYKEEREVFGREVASLRHQLQDMINQQSLLAANNDELLEHLRRLEKGEGEDNALASPTPLHSMLGDCSKLISHVKGILDEQLNFEGMIRELHAVLYSKDQEIEDLNVKVSESDVSRDVVIAYLGSLRDIWSEALKQSYIAVSRRLVGSLALVLGEECESSEDSTDDGFSLVEKNTLLLIEKHTRVLSEIQQLGLYLAEIRSDFVNLEEIEPATVFSAALEELHESKKKEAHLMEKINKLEEENRKMAEQVDRIKDSLEEANTETGKTKIELEQMESKLSTAKEKLSIAVTKGKSLVQHRDSLKQLLAEKTNELEKCLLELQQKSDSLESTKAIAEGLKLSLTEKTSELEKCLLELQHKSDAMEAIEGSTEELKQLLAEQKGEHEKCLLELQEKSDALKRTETSAVELEHSLAEKTSELEKCLLELQQRSDDLETAKTSVDSLTEAQNLVHSLQDSLAHRQKVLHEIEQIVSRDDSPQELPSMEVLDKVRWFINQKHISDEESCKIRNALSSIDLPETISSTDLVSQINWLGKSFTQAKDDIIKLQDEISVARILGLSHESELSEAHKEIDHLTSSLLEEKRKKESVQDELQDVRCKYEEMTENLPKNSAQRDGLMKVLVEVSESALDDQPYVDTDTMIEKCIGQIREKAKNYLTERDHFDRMQSLLYVKDQDLMLCKTIIEEVMIDRTEMMSLSTECGRASEEITTLKNEKDFLQKELERVEERSSLLREKLSMAVKKGKGLVQEREGLKLSLDEKSSEIERLKQELQLQDSAVFEYKEQIRRLSSYPEHIQKLESEIVSLKDQRDEIERFLLESNSTLQRLLDSIESIVLPTDENFEGPIEKVNWIAANIRISEVAKALAEQELEKVKVEATLQAGRLADAFTTIKSLEDQLCKEELQISVITEEKKETQLGKTLIEQELEKVKEECYMQASKLEDACTNIKSLEDALSSANTHISLLNTEMNETESKSKQDINILNVKLADCMEELTKTQCNLANQSEDLVGHIKRLWMLMKDETLFSVITENFRNKIEDLRKMGLIIQNMHDQFAAKGLHIHPGSEYPEFPNLTMLPQFDNFIKERMVHSETVIEDLDSIPSFIKIVEELGAQATFFRDSFEDVSRYMGDHITLTVQALQAARDEFIYMLELRESSKLNVNKLEAQNEVQEVKMLSLQKEIKTLLSACADATQELQIEFPDLLDVGSDSEQQKDNFSLESRSMEAAGGGIDEEVAGESANAIKSLLLTARRIRNQFQQLANVKNMWMTTADDLEHKLRQAEFTAETAIQDGHANQERISTLEQDLEALQNICSEMKIKIEDCQAKENMSRDKEAELLSLHRSLTAKDTGIGDKLFSQDEMETLIDKVTRMEIPFSDLDVPTQVHFSSPVDKLFYIIDKVSEFQDKMESLGFEKEEMQLSLASQVCEVEHLKKAAETTDIDFESKKADLIELAVGLERIIQRLGGNYSFEDQKLITATGLLPVVERLTIASSMESENFKSRIQELGAKLQAKEKVVDELSEKVKSLEDSFHARLAQPDTMKERTVFESSSTVAGSEISEIEDVGPPLGKNSKSPATAAAHVRTMRKGSNDHLVLSIDSESDRLIGSNETDDKGHVFKSLNTSGLVPKQGKLIADRIDGIWVSGGRFLMSRPRARLGLIAYWIFLHLWLLGTIL